MKFRLTTSAYLLPCCILYVSVALAQTIVPANQSAKPSQAQYVAELKKHYEQENFAALDCLAAKSLL